MDGLGKTFALLAAFSAFTIRSNDMHSYNHAQAVDRQRKIELSFSPIAARNDQERQQLQIVPIFYKQAYVDSVQYPVCNKLNKRIT